MARYSFGFFTNKNRNVMRLCIMGFAYYGELKWVKSCGIGTETTVVWRKTDFAQIWGAL